MLKKALYLQLFWSSHTHILLKGNCYCTLLEQYHERAHCLRLTMPLVCVCVCGQIPMKAELVEGVVVLCGR